MNKNLDGLDEFCTVRQLEVLTAVRLHGSNRKAAKELGCSHTAVDLAINALRKKAALRGLSPEHNMTKVVPEGFAVKGVSTYFDNEGNVKGQWVKSTADTQQREVMRQAAFDAMAEVMPRLEPVTWIGSPKDDLCNLYTFTDYHLGMLAWGKECGADWDLSIAEAVLWSSFAKMIEASPNASSCILNIQGDFLHSDGLLPVTPAHKNVLDQDGRFSKIVAVAIRVLRKLIDHALSKHKTVHLIICEGNHDEASSVWLRQMFAAMYEHEPRLTVNDSELPYYVHQHGDVMLSFHHGHKVNNEQLPMLFAAQFSKMWGSTTKRYCHTGHRHHLDEKEYAGMTVTQHPTLSARDAYAARGGWISERSAMAITYHKTAGQYGRTFISPEIL